MNKTLFIIPVYNGANRVSETLRSVANQEGDVSFDILVVNDGSTDDTREVLQKLKAKDKRIKLINQENGGVSSARNKGVEFAIKNNYKYFTFVDDDDGVSSFYLKIMLNIAESAKVDLVSAKIVYSREGLNYTFDNTIDSNVELLDRDEAIKQLLIDGKIKNNSVAKLYRTKSFRDVRFDENIHVGEDMLYCFKCLTILRRKMAVVDSIVYEYKVRKGSATMSSSSMKDVDAYRAALKIHRICSDKFPKHVKFADVKLFTEALSSTANVYNIRNEHKSVFAQLVKTMCSLCGGVWKNGNARCGQRIYAFICCFFGARLAVSSVKAVNCLRFRSRSKLKGLPDE